MLYAKLAVLIREVGALRVRRCGMSERSKVTCRMVNDAMFKSQGSSIRFLVCSFNVVFFWRKIAVIAPVYHIITIFKLAIPCFWTFSSDSRALQKLKELATARTLLKDMPRLSAKYQTYGLEAFHKLLHHFAPKLYHYPNTDMKARFLWQSSSPFLGSFPDTLLVLGRAELLQNFCRLSRYKNSYGHCECT